MTPAGAGQHLRRAVFARCERRGSHRQVRRCAVHRT